MRLALHRHLLLGASLHVMAGAALAQVSVETRFTPQDTNRTHMDVGGAWNGTSDVSALGDIFTLAVSASSDAFDVSLTADLPAGFTDVTTSPALTLSGGPACVGSPTVTASRLVDTISFDLNGFDLAAGCTLELDFGVLAPSGTPSGTYSVASTVNAATVDGGTQDMTAADTVSFLVIAGAAVVSKTPSVIDASVGDSVTWTLEARNTGLGGLFDVTLDETALDTQAGLSFTGFSSSAPGSAVNGRQISLPYLAPGESFSADVSATVAACSGLENTVVLSERTGQISASESGTVQLDLKDPDVSFSVSSTTVDFGGTGTFIIDMQNVGEAATRDLSFATGLNTAPLSVVSVSSGWSYDGTTGTVSRTDDSLEINESDQLIITVADDANTCSVNSSVTVTFSAAYQDACGAMFQTPATIASVSMDPVPTVSLSEGASPRLVAGESGSVQLTLSATEASTLDDDPVEVTYTLPGAIIDGTTFSPSVGTVSCTGLCGSGDTVTWSVPRSNLGAAQTLGINFGTSPDACDAGSSYDGAASVSTSFGAGACPIGDSGSLGFLLSNPSGGLTLQNFNQTGSPFETGSVDDGDGLREEGEGEEAAFQADYAFAGSDPGVWAQSTYEDDFGGLADVTLTSSSLEYRLNGGGWVSVPGGSVSGGSGSFTIDLSFLETVDGDPSVAGDSLSIRYTVTATDDVLATTERRVDQFSTLTVKTGSAGASACGVAGDAVYAQGDRVTWRRASGAVGLSLSDNVIDVCEVVDATLTVSNDSGNGMPIRNLLASLDLGTDFDLVSSTPSYSGGLGGGASVTYNAGDPSFDLLEETLQQTGSATVQVRRRASATNQGGAVTARIDYDDNQTAPAGSRAFSSAASAAPLLVNTAELDIFVSPQVFPVTTDSVSWIITVRNLRSGVAANVEVSDLIPSGLSVDAADITTMDGLNPFPVTVNGSSLNWSVGDLAPGGAVDLRVVASVAGTTCTIPTGSNLVQAEWGCGGEVAQSSNSTRPDLLFPSGNLQIIHDTSGSAASLCGEGQIVVRARNVGLSEIKDVEVIESLNSASTGMTLVAGSVEYSSDDGTSWTQAGTVSSGTDLTFNSGNIPPLALLTGNGLPGDEVLIRFRVDTTAATNGSAGISAAATGELHCGDPVTSPGQSFNVPLQRPRMVVAKTGRNLTTGTSSSETVFAAPGDTVEWTVTVTNNGNLATNELRLRDVLAGSNGSATLAGPGFSGSVSADYVAIDEIPAGGSATYTITEILGSSCVNNANVADVTWGCSAQPAGNASELSSPVDNTDGADLRMRPTANDIEITQTLTDSAGTGGLTTSGRVQVEIENSGAPFTAANLTSTLPAGYVFDPSFTPTISSAGNSVDAYSGVSVNASNAAEPVFTLTGSGTAFIRNGETVTLEFAIYQTAALDTSADEDVREEVAGTDDPTPVADGTSTAELSYESGCGTSGTVIDSQAVAPKTPDLDIDILNPISRIVAAVTDTETYTVRVSNNGDTAAEDGTLDVNIGGGWTGSVPTGCAGAIPGSVTCDLSGASAIGMGGSRDFAFNLTVANETSPLSFDAQVTGEVTDAAGAATGGNYSFDTIRARTLGFRQSLDLISTSETDFDGPADVQIGEEALLRITSVWFGGDSDPIEAPTVALDFERTTGFALIDETVTSGQAIASRADFSAPDATSVIYQFGDLNGGGAIVIDATVRALNNGANTSGASVDFVSDASSAMGGVAFDDASAGYPAAVDRTETLIFERPALGVVKEVLNETLSGTFADSAEGDAGDDFLYRIVIENTGTAPAFDIVVSDLVPDDFTIADFASDGLDNDGDGSTSNPNEGQVTSQTITFDGATSSSPLIDELASGASVTLTYRTTADAAVNPSAAAINTADFSFDTLAGASGGQTAPAGANGDANGAFETSGQVQATVNITAVDLAKNLTVTSVGADTSANVVVGEQATFELDILLPSGSIADFLVEDVLPEGLALVARDPVQFGTAVSCAASTASPSTLPASGTPVTVSWDFGACTIADQAEADRRVKITYTTQVENLASVSDSDTLENLARYNHSRVADPVDATPVTLTVIEPDLALTMTVSPDTNLDGGDTGTITLTVSNSGAAPAFNLILEALLNDNGVADGADDGVDVAASIGDAARDIAVWDCAVPPSDQSVSPGDFSFSFVGTDGDGDGNADNSDDCRVDYTNISTDGLASGASVSLEFDLQTGLDLISNSTYLQTALLEATSLPSTAPGSGNATYERSASSDPTASEFYAATATDGFSSRNTPTVLKTFSATSDPNTLPDSGNAVTVAIGETYTARVTYRFDEGTTLDARLRERIRLDGVNIPGDVEVVAVRMARTSTDLQSSLNPGGINAAAANSFVDVTGSVTATSNAQWNFLEIPAGTVTNGGGGSGLSTGRNLESFIVEYDLRVRNVSENSSGRVLRDQGQIRRDDAEGNSQGYSGGQARLATLAEPSFVVSKTTADADGILSGGETVSYTLKATNAGTAPGYNLVLEDVLPPALRASGVSVQSITIGGGAPSIAPVQSYDPATGRVRWTFSDADFVAAGDEIEITYTATADASVQGGTTHTNTFEVVASFSQASSSTADRRQNPRSNQASVTLGAPEIAFRPDQASSTQPGSTVIYPHRLTVPGSLAGASLSFATTSSQGQAWQMWYDADGNGVLSGGDQAWVDGSVLPATGELVFFAQTQVSASVHDGWRDVTTITASVDSGSAVLSGSVTDITTATRLLAGDMTAGKFMAIDRDCDGSLSDETVADSTFEELKTAAPGECVVYRITFRNDGVGELSDVEVVDMTPAYTSFVSGSASYETVPSGLLTLTIQPPLTTGSISFPFSGVLRAGAEGAVRYGVKIND